MIIQKLASAIRRQDWFQVVIEVMIVIVGIFLGLQVQAWYEEQKQREEEQVYLNKLLEEVVLMSELSARRLGEKTVFVTDLQETLHVLAGSTPPTELGPQHCTALLQSTNYQNSVGRLTSISEAESNDRSWLIQNQQIADMISDYIRLHERWDNLEENSRQGSVILPIEFPDFFQLKTTTNIKARRINEDSHSCNFNLMYGSEAFKNILHSNARKYSVIITFYGFHHDRLVALHSALDRELGISHEGENP